MLLALALASALTIDGLPRPQGERWQDDPTIYQAIDTAISEAIQAHSDRLTQLEHRVAQRERVLDYFAGCMKSAFIVAGSDLVSTGLARERCPTCAEQNPLVHGDLGLVGLKLGQLGSQVAICKAAAEGGTRATKIVTRTNQAIHALAILANGWSAITGKPLIKWGAAK